MTCGQDGHRDFGRRAAAEVEPDRRMDARSASPQPGRAQALHALGVGARLPSAPM
jgi:hypothetical protein